MVIPTGLHLGNDPRGGKIRFYESKGGDGLMHTASGVGLSNSGNFPIMIVRTLLFTIVNSITIVDFV